jgi:surface carbohydrate biosynthesis protein
MNLYIPVEVKNRELHAKVYLAKHAAEKGFNVILGRKNDLNELIVRMPPGVYFGLGAFENFRHYFAKLKWLGFTIVVNEEEGLVTYADRMYVDMRVSGATLQQIDELFTWGAENQGVLTDAFPELETKFAVTGNPRFDLLKPQNRQVYAAEMDEIEAKYGRFVLVCTSFSSINHFDKKLDYIKSLIEKKTLRSQESIENFTRYREVKQKTFTAFLEAIPGLAAMDPSVNIIIRPHPSENMDIYQEFAAKFPNVHVDARFSVHPWIIKAEALVHHYCTTSIEALMADTPRFALRPLRDPLSEKEIPFECSVECASVDELIGRISECLAAGKGNWHGKPLTQDYSRYVSNIDDHLAAEAIVSRITALCNAPENGVRCHADRVKTFVAKTAYIAKKALRSVLRRNGKNLHYLDHKFAHLSRNEVEGILRAFEPGSVPIECRSIAGDFINIRRSTTPQKK